MNGKTMKGEFMRFQWILLALCALWLSSCKDDKDTVSGPYDPNQPVEVTDFTPKSGGTKVRMIIYGSNFGTDPSIISVRIGGKEAKVISAKNNCLYCITPDQCYEGTIELTIGESPTITIPDKYKYIQQMIVTTLCGHVDELGNGEIKKEGPFSDCGKIDSPTWFSFDPKFPNLLYLTQDNGDQGKKPIRILDLEREYISTGLAAGSDGVGRFRSITWTLDGDTMIIACSKGDVNGASNIFMTRQGNFMDQKRLTTGNGCQASAIHPRNGELYFNNFAEGMVIRYDYHKWGINNNKEHQEKLYAIQDREWEFNYIIHPSGKYAYIMVMNRHYILRANYDEENKAFTNPYVVCGAPGQAGYADKIGAKARLNRPYQGVFVKNPEYEAAGKDEIYDFYFTDRDNHCIRKLTPDGITTTFAGRGSVGMNVHANGYVDGALREEARFNSPAALAYDEANNTFYVGDVDNHRIRKIALEEIPDDLNGDQSNEKASDVERK